MKLFWKGAVAVGLAITTLGVTAAPAQAQHYRDGYDHRDDREWRGDRYGDRRWDSRWDSRRDWRDHRRHWRDDRRGYYRHYRQRCWTEWRYNPYRDRNVRVRICR